MPKINFNKLTPLFEAGEDFSLTESQYKKNTGYSLPKEIYYLKNKSAFSKLARQYGYDITVKEKTICLKKKEG